VVAKAVGADPRITPSHTKVPGFDGKQGFGGACFPKDVSAFLSAYSEMGILEFVKNTNNQYRNKYEKDSREIEQNVKFS
jgi:UDP-glucose 6-dehydrogenase